MPMTLETMSQHEISWPWRTSDLGMKDTAAHVWAACLDVSESELTNFASVLSPNEKARAERFRFEIHRNRFIAGRGLLRTILGMYLKIQPDRIQFGLGKNGKPFLSERGKGLEFNLAHSEEMALVAVTA